MNHVRHTSASARRQLARSRTTGQIFFARRRYATQPPPPPSPSPPPPPPPPPPHEPSRVGTYYKSFGSPVLKCFLGALFTYQVVYYAWLKLEAAEEAHDTAAEISGLQQELRAAVAEKAQGVGERVRSAVPSVGKNEGGTGTGEGVGVGEKGGRKGGWFW